MSIAQCYYLYDGKRFDNKEDLYFQVLSNMEAQESLFTDSTNKKTNITKTVFEKDLPKGKNNNEDGMFTFTKKQPKDLTVSFQDIDNLSTLPRKVNFVFQSQGNPDFQIYGIIANKNTYLFTKTGYPLRNGAGLRNSKVALEYLNSQNFIDEYENGSVPKVRYEAATSEKQLEVIGKIEANNGIYVVDNVLNVYINTQNGKKLRRVTNVIHGDEEKTGKYLNAAKAIGTGIDVLNRDIMNFSLKSYADYTTSAKTKLFDTKEAFDRYVEGVIKLKNILEARGEKIVTNNGNEIVLFDEESGIAGAVDLMTVDAAGRVRIYDYKTMRGNQFTETIEDGTIKYDAVYPGNTMSNRESHTKQQSYYKALFEKQYGFPVETINIISIELNKYDELDRFVLRADIAKFTQLTPIDVDLKKARPTVVKASFVEFSETYTPSAEDIANAEAILNSEGSNKILDVHYEGERVSLSEMGARYMAVNSVKDIAVRMTFDEAALALAKSNAFNDYLEQGIQEVQEGTVNNNGTPIKIKLPDTQAEIDKLLERPVPQRDAKDIQAKTGISYIDTFFIGGKLDTQKVPQLLTQLIQESSRTSDKALLRILAARPEILSNLPFIVDTTLQGKGVAKVNSEGRVTAIHLNPNMFRNEVDARKVLIEEMIHAVIYDELRTNPTFNTNINLLRESTINYFGRDKYNNMKRDQAILKNLQDLRNTSELNELQQAEYDRISNDKESKVIFYRLSNVDEFVVGTLISEEFQRYLQSIDINDASMKEVKESLWDRVITMIAEFLNIHIGSTNKKNPILKLALYNSLNLVESASEQIQKYPGILDIAGTHRKTIQELNTMFNLADSEQNRNIIDNQLEVADFINRNVYNVTADPKEDGTIALFYTASKDLFAGDEEFSTESVPDDDLDVSFFGTAEQIGATGSLFDKSSFRNRIKSYISNLRDRQRTLKKSLKLNQFVEGMSEEDAHIAAVNSIAIGNELDHVRELLNNVNKKGAINIVNLTALKEQALIELDHIREFMNKGMNSSDIKYALETTRFWLNSKEMLFNEADFKDPLMIESFNDLEATASLTDQILIEKLNDWVMTELVDKQTTNTKSLSKILEDMKDIGLYSTPFADLSTTNSPIMQALGKYIKYNDVLLTKRREEKVKEYSKVLKEASSTLKALGSNKSRYEIFRQLDKFGNPTRNMVSRYSNEYMKERRVTNYVYQANKNKSSEEAYEAYRFFKNNTEKYDLEALFPKDNGEVDQAAYDAEVARLQGIMGNTHFVEWLNDQKKKIEEYNRTKAAQKDHVVDRFSLQNEEEIPNHLDAVNYMSVWEQKNSPYIIMQHLNNNIVENPFKLKDGYLNFKYVVDIPSRIIKDDNENDVDSGYYDTKFETIERNRDLLAVHMKFQEIMRYIGTIIPYESAERLAFGSIPEFQKEMYLALDGKLKNTYTALGEGLTDMLRSEQYEHLQTEKDIVTGRTKRTVRLGISTSNQKINDELYIEQLRYFKEHGVVTSSAQDEEMKSKITAKYAEEMEFDLGKVFDMYLKLGLAYETRAEQEDTLNLTQIMLDNQKEFVRNNKGELLQKAIASTNNRVEYETKSTKESFLKYKELLDHTIRSISYNDNRDINSTKKKIYTKAEKREKAIYEQEIEHVKQLVEDGLYTEVAGGVHINKIQGMIDNLGAYGDTEKWVDLPIKYTQIVGMGWNVIGGISNMTFGTAANFIEGAGEEFYTSDQLMNAYGKVMHSVLRNATFNKGGGKEALKIRALMDTYDIMAESGKEYKDLIGSDPTERLGWLAAFNANQRTEYVNQAPLMIVMLQNTKFEHNGQEHSLYDAFDMGGEWDVDKYGEYPEDLVNNTILKIKALVQRNHGNYNPLAPMLAKRKGLGRLALQFRGWMIEGVKVRWGDRNGREDAILGSEIKGRYWSVIDGYMEQGAGKMTKAMVLQILRNFIPFKNAFGVSKSPIDRIFEGTSIKQVDLANMKRMAFELNTLIGGLVVGMLLKALAGGLDDDDDLRLKALYLLMNQSTRLVTDVHMYVDPVEAMKVLQDPVPSMRIIKSFTDITTALKKTIIDGSPDYENGIYEGQNRIINAIGKGAPATRAYFSTISNTSQAFE